MLIKKGEVKMREITSHQVNPCNNEIIIKVVDEPGPDGANHHYAVELPIREDVPGLNIQFQNGPIQETGVNGVTQEALLAICIDRLQSFQEGPFACRENALALTKLEEAVHWLNSRTQARVERGVEGTNQI
jgi:hypothetical protein